MLMKEQPARDKRGSLESGDNRAGLSLSFPHYLEQRKEHMLRRHSQVQILPRTRESGSHLVSTW